MHRHSSADLDAEVIDAIVGKNVALVWGWDESDRQTHMKATKHLLSSKHWEGAVGLDLTSEMSVTVAANAAVLVHALEFGVLRNVRSIIVHPTARTSSSLRAGAAHGVFSDAAVSIIGNALPNTGPLTLAWDAVLDQSRRPDLGQNVVLHEFAHKIDMSDGYADGVPPMKGPQLVDWQAILDDEYAHAVERRSDHVLRTYSWTNPAEFFAVATESFFCRPAALRSAKPALYAGLASFYRQDRATRFPGSERPPSE